MAKLEETEVPAAEVAYIWRKLAAPQRAPTWAQHGAVAAAPAIDPGAPDQPSEVELGFAEGLAKGQAQAEAEVAERLAALDELIDRAQIAREAFMTANASALGDAIVSLFKVVFHYELMSSPALLESLVAEASAMLDLQGPVVLELHPDEHSRLAEALGTEPPQCVANDTLLPGSLRLVGGEGMHDLDIAARLQGVLQDFIAASEGEFPIPDEDGNDLP